MKILPRLFRPRLLMGLAALTFPGWIAVAAQPECWLTAPDQGVLFQKQSTGPEFSRTEPVQQSTITVDTDATFQSIDGFGYTLTGGSAAHLMKMKPEARVNLLKELFATDSTNIGISYLRLSIGASDLNPSPFSYNDLSPGETDPEIAKFSFGPDQEDVIPAL